MKVELKDLSETRKQLVVAFDAAEVDQELAKVTGEFLQHARIPGFRPGRAPVAIIQKRFGKEIAQELRQAVFTRAYRDGVKESKLDVLQVIDIPEVEIIPGSPAEIPITVDVSPTVTLPEYTGIPIKPFDLTVTDADVEGVIEGLRRERAEFKTVERAAETGDYVKFGFEGTLDGQKIAELVPERPIYGSIPHTWEEAGSSEGLLPGAGHVVIGLKAGDTKQADIAFPADFSIAVLAGKTGNYTFTVQEVRERILPPVDEAFLKLQNVTTTDELRTQVRTSLEQRKQAEARADKRRQVSEGIASRVDFPLPETLVESETEVILRQLVEQNVRRGIPQEELEKNKNEIYATARQLASGRTKLRLILVRVAEAEKLTVTREELSYALYREAQRTGQKPEKLFKELEKDRDRLAYFQQNILFDKALDFLVDKATVSTV